MPFFGKVAARAFCKIVQYHACTKQNKMYKCATQQAINSSNTAGLKTSYHIIRYTPNKNDNTSIGKLFDFMTAYPVRYYFLAVMLALSVYFFYLNAQTGIIYCLFFLLSAVTLSFLKSTFYKGAYFIILFAVAIGYFARPLVLVNHPELFQYKKIAAQTDINAINEALRYALISMVFLSAGFVITVKSIPDKITSSVRMPYFMTRNFDIINIILIALTLTRLALAIYSNAGIKGQTADTVFAFALRLLSPEMSFIIYYVYLSRHWKRLNLQRRIIVLSMIGLTAFSVFITGSKAFLAIFGLCIFISIIYKNRKIKVYSFLWLSLASLVLLAFSFVMAAAVKFSGSRDPGAIIAKAGAFVNAGSLLTISNDITIRMVGLDGQIGSYIISNQLNPKEKILLQESFSGKEIILHTLNNIVPKVEFTYTPSTAKLASEYFDGHTLDKVHTGAIGLFAAIYFMCGPYFFIFNLAFGAVLGYFFTYVRKIKNEDLKFVLFFVGCYFILRIVLSGNFDIILGEFFVELVTLFIYIRIILLTGKR